MPSSWNCGMPSSYWDLGGRDRTEEWDMHKEVGGLDVPYRVNPLLRSGCLMCFFAFGF